MCLNVPTVDSPWINSLVCSDQILAFDNINVCSIFVNSMSQVYFRMLYTRTQELGLKKSNLKISSWFIVYSFIILIEQFQFEDWQFENQTLAE